MGQVSKGTSSHRSDLQRARTLPLLVAQRHEMPALLVVSTVPMMKPVSLGLTMPFQFQGRVRIADVEFLRSISGQQTNRITVPCEVRWKVK